VSLRRLILRSLWHYRRTNLAVLFGLAVATAVITGSLIVGDSVTGSIRDTALERLGSINYVFTSRHFVHESIIQELKDPSWLRTSIPPLRLKSASIILAAGTVQNADTEAAVPNATILGIDQAFGMFYTKAVPELADRDAAVNESLARDLRLRRGDAIIFTIGKPGSIPADNLFTRRKRGDVIDTVRLRIVAILPDRGTGGFAFTAGTTAPRNLFLSKTYLQSVLGVKGKANAFLLAPIDPRLKDTSKFSDEQRPLDFPLSLVKKYLNKYSSAYRRKIDQENAATIFWNTVFPLFAYSRRLDDLGITLTPNPHRGYLAVQSDEMVLPEAMVFAVKEAAKECGAHVSISSVYLATTISTGRPGVKYDVPPPSIAYALVGAVEPREPFTFTAGGGKEPSKHGIWLNTWAAEDLHARVGTPVTLDYLVPQPDGSYGTGRMSLNVEGIVQIAGPADDRGLMPPFKGITDTESIDQWDPPFPIDLRRVTPRDDAYWQQYRTTPKAFVNPATAHAMWASGRQADWVTTVMIDPPHGMSLATLTPKFTAALRSHATSDASMRGILNKIPVRKYALRASRGTTDFGQLFLAMSFFLVLAAAGLAGMLMRLTVERRAAEAGIMTACGFGAGQVRRALWGEGLVLALCGLLLGVPLGLGYAAGIIGALGSWWAGAVGGAALWLHLTAGALVIGGISGLIIGLLAMAWGSWSLGKQRVLDLLAGWRMPEMTPRRAVLTAAILVLVGLLLLAILLIVLALGKRMPAEDAFFGGGALLLCAGICGGYLALARWLQSPLTAPTLARLALRSAAANRGRSLLVVGLLAGAGFIIVAVAANVRDFSRLDVYRKDSGAGGFSLRAIATVPLPVDISTPAGRAHLDFSPEDEALFKDVKIYPLLYSGGDDISCLNLAAAQQPRIVGISDAFIERGSFSVITREHKDNPWTSLRQGCLNNFEMNHMVFVGVNAFGDADSVMWSLHKELGGYYNIPTSSAGRLPLIFAGLLPGSIFAGELLISEKFFRQLYPEITQPRYYLIETPPERDKQKEKAKEEAVANVLRKNLGDFGLEVRGTRELLNAYAGVQNTYLSTFLALGGLGLMLGTLGLVIVLLRNALERRKEFALLLAQGFTERDLAAMLVIENAGLLAAGLLCGTVTALIAVAPHLASVSARVNWGALLGVLAGILIVGLISCFVAARTATRGGLLQALREE